jgi:hypothetical protein
MSERILVCLQGGLGNQLFQYTAGVALATKLGGQLWLTPCQENKHSGRDYRKSLYKRAKAVGPDGVPTNPADVFYHQSDAFKGWTPEQFQAAQTLYTKGYYQYLPAIQSVISLVREDLIQSLQPIREELKAKYRIVMPRETAFVHVRRGDYLKNENSIFWKQGQDYYEPALKMIPGPKRWLVLSDDVEWCREQPWFQPNSKGDVFEFVNEPDELRSLALMSLCQGAAVIANSTFSWWGAILAGAGGTTVYPKRWIGLVKPQLFPQHWVGAGPEVPASASA